MSFEFEDGRPVADRWRDIVRNVKEEYLSTTQEYPWIVGFSGGKDSTVVAHAVFEALLAIPPSRRTRQVHIVSNDTMVESPLVMAHLDDVSHLIEGAVDSLELPITVARTKPDLDKTFWVLLIGKGYPSPNSQMRWCTDRLKIQPTSTYIRENVSQYGAAIVVLGVRRTESIRRMQTINKYENVRGTNLNEHASVTGALIFRPIVDLSTDDVWEILGSFPAPWGGTHRKLFQLYRDAEGGECPVVLSKEEAPGCGTKNSRFGCWTCTVVEKDKSLQGFIDSGQHAYKPLVAFRDWLVDIRNDPTRRSAIRRNGRLTFDVSGKHIPGPFTIQARREILERLLQVQEEFGAPLISEEEVDLIHKLWAEDLQTEEGLANV
ncbi:DNA phosphorothioation system sulfurtransferase DndC [Paracidovorax anthurii]|uniref:DNA sulfur modification protein DndC n=1 Tax=Paracidovorax anthurii TaxID=78229 RepID=A0A328Y9B4_9BURK|nr:DNA phosphorothioation system sulfurtransferase DndC [Paracidovorax anthurii]RAR70598.1 DNA sulfur modification protein DndC [Paracidovorax anthurii]